jgi:hypothetical protein
MAMSPTWRRAANTPRRRPERLLGVTPPAKHTRAAAAAIHVAPRPLAASRTSFPGASGIVVAAAVDRFRAWRFDHRAMSQPRQIYASTLDRRGRRWSRRRALWPLALIALIALAGLALLAGVWLT